MPISVAGILGTLFKIGEDASTGAIKREHIALLQSQIQAFVQKVEDLEEENSRLQKQNQESNRQIAEYSAREQFGEARGILFKKKAAGGYECDPFCPRCRLVMFPSVYGYACTACKFKAPFGASGLNAVMAMLPSDEAK